MSQLSHLDELEAEAIYIIQRSCGRVRKACNALLNRQGQLGNAPSCNEGVLSRKTAVPVLYTLIPHGSSEDMIRVSVIATAKEAWN